MKKFCDPSFFMTPPIRKNYEVDGYYLDGQLPDIQLHYIV